MRRLIKNSSGREIMNMRKENSLTRKSLIEKLLTKTKNLLMLSLTPEMPFISRRNSRNQARSLKRISK